jgi:hypothetical protein
MHYKETRLTGAHRCHSEDIDDSNSTEQNGVIESSPFENLICSAVNVSDCFQ